MTRRPTIIDVAQLAGVSKATVARVVNGNEAIVREATRQRVLEAIDQLGYVRNAVAGGLRSDRTMMIALCIPDITNPFWPEVARGVQDTIEQEAYTVVTVNSDWQAEREENYLRMVRQNRFDGLIINPTKVTSTELLALKIPVVIIGSGTNYPEFDSVGSDSETGMVEALNHLFEQGHRRIALIKGLSARKKSATREQVFVSFHAQNHLPLDKNLIIDSEFSRQGGYKAMRQLLQMDNPPTAVFAANDILAIGALKAAHHQQVRVPDEIAIVGMDDIDATEMTSPPITTVKKPKYEIGAQAARLLLDHLSNEQPNKPRQILLQCELAIRGSTVPAEMKH